MDNQIKQWDEAAEAIIQQESASMDKTDSELRDEIVNKAFAAVPEPLARPDHDFVLKNYGVCVLHGLVDRPHRCRDYDGEDLGMSIHRIKDIVRDAHLEPIRKALDACVDDAVAMSECGDIMVCKSDWDALVKSVKGESDR